MAKPEHNPTPDEIAAGCAAIRAGWSVEEEFRRRVVRSQRHVIPGAEREPIWEQGDAESLRRKVREKLGVGQQWVTGRE